MSHNNTSSSEQVHLLLSHIKVQPCISLELLWLVNGAWSVQISILIKTIHNFHWRMLYYELWTLNTSWFLTKTYLSSQDINWWTGVVWITVMFLSDSHSDGTHSLQSIHWWVMQCYISPNLMQKQTHLYFGWPEGWREIGSKCIFFLWTIHLCILVYVLPL